MSDHSLMPPRDAVSDAALDRIFRTARTHNGWANRSVDDQTIREIYELAKLGPTSSNSNPARFIWVKSAPEKERLAECALGTNPEKIRKAPVTVIVARDRRFYEKMTVLFPVKPEMAAMMRNVPQLAEATARRNATLQGAYLIIAARALGLDCGPMSGFDPKKVSDAFLAGTDHEVDFLCSIGYGTDEGLFPRLPRLPFEEANRIA